VLGTNVIRLACMLDPRLAYAEELLVKAGQVDDIGTRSFIGARSEHLPGRDDIDLNLYTSLYPSMSLTFIKDNLLQIRIVPAA